MKKSNILIVIMLCFMALLLADYFNFSFASAADNLKVLQEQYKSSYNRFMKALNDGADQEYINKLTVKCKNDYAAYQKALKSSKDFKNTANTATINNNSSSDFQLFDQLPLTDSENIKNPNFKPLRIKESIKTPKRIGSIATSEIDLFKPTPLPSDQELMSMDGTPEKADYINIIKRMHNSLTSNGAYFKDEMEYILSDASKFPDLCALAILYHVENEIKRIMKPDSMPGYTDAMILDYELNLKNMLIEATEMFSQGKKINYKICQDVINIISMPNGRLDTINNLINNQQKKIKDNTENAIINIKTSKNNLIAFESTVYVGTQRPNQQQILANCNGIIKSYRTLIESNLASGNYPEAQKYSDDLNNFYKNEFKNRYVIKYKQNSVEASEVISLAKTPDEFLTTQYQFYENMFKGKAKDFDYEKLKADLKTFSDYSEGVPHSGEYNPSLPWMTTMGKDLLNKISAPFSITNFKLTKNGKEIKSDSGEIIDPHGSFTLRFRANRSNYDKTTEVTLENLSSTKKFKLQFKRSNFFDNSYSCEYYLAFVPSDSNDESNILTTDKSNPPKDSITIAKAELGFPSLQSLYENKFFKSKMGFGSINFPSNDYAKGYYKFTADFLRSGGVEAVRATINDTTIDILFKNQASWVVFTGHGNPKSGSIGTYDPYGNDPNAIIITPGKDKIDIPSQTVVPGLIRADGTSRYDENVNYLILNSCGVLNNRKNVDLWHNVLPNGLILGYSKKIHPFLAEVMLAEVNGLLTQPLLPKTLAEKWAEINLKYYNQYASWLWGYSGGARYSYIHENKWHKGILSISFCKMLISVSMVEPTPEEVIIDLNSEGENE